MVTDRLISHFDSTETRYVNKTSLPVWKFLEQIKMGVYKDTIEKVRAGDKDLKTTLPTVAFQGTFVKERKKANFTEATGLIILDIDDVDVDEIADIKQEIMETDESVLAVMVSPSGNGIKVLYHVMPELVNADNYRDIGKEVIKNFDIYGDVDVLSITDTLIMTYDPDIMVNEDALPAMVYIKPKEKKSGDLEERDKNIPLWDDPEDFFETVLVEQILERTNNNFHFIQVSMLELAKFGFYHPQEDLSFVIYYSEENFKSSSENQSRFESAALVASEYPQQRWPYKLVSDYEDDEVDGEIDYSEYKEADSDSRDDDQPVGLVDYSDLFERTLAVAKEGDRVGFEISLTNFADIFRFKGTGICTVTGIPSHGKTEFMDQCILDLARMYGQETLVAGFEQTPEEHIIKLSRKLVGKNITCKSWLNDRNLPTFRAAYNYVTKYIKHINVEKTGGNINKILEAAAARIAEAREEGQDPKYLLIDPFNMLSIKGRLTGHEKIEEILRKLTHFSHQMKVMVLLVAHPFKMKKSEQTGEYEVPDFYSVKGSSAFFEMSYHGLVVYRIGASTKVFVKVLKVKQNNLGKQHEQAYFDYLRDSGRYVPTTVDGSYLEGDYMDHDWMDKFYKQN